SCLRQLNLDHVDTLYPTTLRPPDLAQGRRSAAGEPVVFVGRGCRGRVPPIVGVVPGGPSARTGSGPVRRRPPGAGGGEGEVGGRAVEHTAALQSRDILVCRLVLEHK